MLKNLDSPTRGHNKPILIFQYLLPILIFQGRIYLLYKMRVAVQFDNWDYFFNGKKPKLFQDSN